MKLNNSEVDKMSPKGQLKFDVPLPAGGENGDDTEVGKDMVKVGESKGKERVKDAESTGSNGHVNGGMISPESLEAQ